MTGAEFWDKFSPSAQRDIDGVPTLQLPHNRLVENTPLSHTGMLSICGILQTKKICRKRTTVFIAQLPFHQGNFIDLSMPTHMEGQ